MRRHRVVLLVGGNLSQRNSAMNLARGLTRLAIVAAIFVFTVGTIHKLLSERMAGLFGNPEWLRGFLGIVFAGGVVLAALPLLFAIFPDFSRRMFRWALQGFKKPEA